MVTVTNSTEPCLKDSTFLMKFKQCKEFITQYLDHLKI